MRFSFQLFGHLLCRAITSNPLYRVQNRLSVDDGVFTQLYTNPVKHNHFAGFDKSVAYSSITNKTKPIKTKLIQTAELFEAKTKDTLPPQWKTDLKIMGVLAGRVLHQASKEKDYTRRNKIRDAARLMFRAIDILTKL